MVRSPHRINNADEGLVFIIPLLKRVFKMMNLLFMRVTVAERSHQLNYVSLHKSTQYNFRGYPDYIVHKDVIGTGEIQSTLDPDIQNSIYYGVGSLLKQLPEKRPIVCITLFKMLHYPVQT